MDYTLNGPDFLDAVAQAEQSNGLPLNAAEYSKRAREWRDDLSAGSVARDANDLLSRELVKLRRDALEIYDLLSQVRPHSEHAVEYSSARTRLARVADIPLGPPAYAGLHPGARDPRVQPMPGDRFYLPVMVTFANYGPGQEISATLAPLVDAAPTEATFHVYASNSPWLLGAIGIVPAPTREAIEMQAAA